MKIKLFGSILLVICFIVAISGCTSNNNSSNTTANVTTTTNSQGVFENKFVKFNYPENLVVVDNSTDTYPEIYIFSGTPTIGGYSDPKYIGDIVQMSTDYMTTVNDSTKTVNLNGTKAIEWKDSTLNRYSLFIPSKALLFEINTNYTTAYNTIRNSLIIK
jgi:hypothetical protein